MTSLRTAASQKSALPSQFILFKYKNVEGGKTQQGKNLKNSEKWLLRKPLHTPLVSTLLPQIPARISVSVPNPLNTTMCYKEKKKKNHKITGLNPFYRWLVLLRARRTRAGSPLPRPSPPLPPRSSACRDETPPPLFLMDASVPKGTQLNYELALTRARALACASIRGYLSAFKAVAL